MASLGHNELKRINCAIHSALCSEILTVYMLHIVLKTNFRFLIFFLWRTDLAVCCTLATIKPEIQIMFQNQMEESQYWGGVELYF